MGPLHYALMLWWVGGGLHDFCVGPSLLVTNWDLELIETWLGLGLWGLSPTPCLTSFAQM